MSTLLLTSLHCGVGIPEERPGAITKIDDGFLITPKVCVVLDNSLLLTSVVLAGGAGGVFTGTCSILSSLT